MQSNVLTKLFLSSTACSLLLLFRVLLAVCPSVIHHKNNGLPTLWLRFLRPQPVECGTVKRSAIAPVATTGTTIRSIDG
ncbi:hypothetical protein niasHS_006132 [Heterodera schachtii]|uniref:Secreted protein n=1 Tax=Heterodera schachtii TaxID=97005 RepID=A0ABD2JW36_HETSC